LVREERRRPLGAASWLLREGICPTSWVAALLGGWEGWLERGDRRLKVGRREKREEREEREEEKKRRREERREKRERERKEEERADREKKGKRWRASETNLETRESIMGGEEGEILWEIRKGRSG